jgi:hypothetical protein
MTRLIGNPGYSTARLVRQAVEAVVHQFVEAARAERVLDKRENVRHVADEVAHAAEFCIVAVGKEILAVLVHQSLDALVLFLPPRGVLGALRTWILSVVGWRCRLWRRTESTK